MGGRSADVELVDGFELELDLLPGLHCDGQLRTVAGGLGEDVAGLPLQLAALVASLYAGLQRDAVGRGTGGVAPGVTLSTAPELEHRVVAEDGQQGRHVPDVDTAGGNGHDAGHGAPVLVEEDTAGAVLGHVGFAKLVNEAQLEAFQETHKKPIFPLDKSQMQQAEQLRDLMHF